VEGENRGRYPFSNSLLLKGRNLTALIDTGIGPERARELAKEEKVDLLLVSHGHEDHFCQNRLFEGAKVLCHREDAPAVRSVKRLEALYGCPNEEIGNGMMEFLIGMVRGEVCQFVFAYTSAGVNSLFFTYTGSTSASQPRE